MLKSFFTALLLSIAAGYPCALVAQDCDILDYFDPDSTWSPQEADFVSQPWYDQPDYLPAFYDSLLNALDGNNPPARLGIYGETPLFRVPVRFWVYRDDNGQNGGYRIDLPKDEDIQLILDNANHAFIANGVRIQLYLHSVRNIDNSKYLRDLSGFTRSTLAVDYRLKGVLNAHIVPEGNGLYTGLAPAIFLPRRVYNDDDNGGVNTMAHEVGHYFGLWHTHSGYNIPCQKEQVDRGVYTRAICWLVPRRWCSVTGDGFCDTPADPNMSELPEAEQPRREGRCTWISDLQDGRGDDFMPQVDNYMAYANHPCRSRFTDEQKMAMLWTASSRALSARGHGFEYLNTPDNQVDYFEPDNTPRSARAVRYGITQPRTFHFSGQRDDMDWYRVDHPAEGALGDYSLYVSNYDGVTVGDVTVFPVVNGLPGPQLTNLRVQRTESNTATITLNCANLEPGRSYLIRISRGTARTGAYIFRIDQPGEQLSIAGPATLCEEKTGTYTLEGLGLLNDPPGIQWSITPNIRIMGLSEDKRSFYGKARFGSEGTETVAATLSNGCGIKIVRRSGLLVGMPTAMGPVTGPSTASEGSMISFFGDASTVLRAESYIWTLPSSNAPCASGPGCWEVLSKNGASYMKAAVGTQSGYVQLAAINYCGTGIPTVKWVSVNTEEGSGAGPSVWEKTVLSPNPGQGDADLSFPDASGEMPAAYTVQVFDQYRTLLYEKSHKAAKHSLPTHQLKAGLYIIQVITPEGVKTVQYLKE